MKCVDKIKDLPQTNSIEIQRGNVNMIRQNGSEIPEYNETMLKFRYERKKEECTKRLIPFEFSLQEWFDFHKLLYIDDIHCAYTNKEFIHKQGHSYYPTIERLDNMKPYSPLNCVWIISKANKLKSCYIESNGDKKKLNVQERNDLTRIEKIVQNPDNIYEIQKPYSHLFNTQEQDKLIVQEQHNTTQPINSEISIAQQYITFGKQIESLGGGV